MADTFGALEYPATPQGSTESLSDSALDRVGAFLAAVINANLGDVWSTVQPGGKPVENVVEDDPEVGALNDRDLPGLFVWRGNMQEVRETDEWHTDHCEMHVLWVPQPVPQAQSARLRPFFNGVAKSIFNAIVLGRHPAWVDPGDDDPNARQLGSMLIDRCGFLFEPKIIRCSPYITKIQSDTTTRRYPSVLAKIATVESTYWDPSLRGSPAAHTTTASNNGVPLVNIQDPVVV